MKESKALGLRLALVVGLGLAAVLLAATSAFAGTQITLAGSDDEGDNITVRGTVDGTGTMLKANYILNGSASGRCETDDGTGNLAKR